jgi:hypothetical protein
MKRPTLKEQVQVFHKIMHIANLAQISGKTDHLSKIIGAMDLWSYAHRMGNGQFTDSQQQKIIDNAFWRLKEIVENRDANT